MAFWLPYWSGASNQSRNVSASSRSTGLLTSCIQSMARPA